MPEKTLFKSENTLDRSTIADYLRSVADSLEAGRPITLKAGDQSVTLDPPGRLTFEVKAEREGPMIGSGELSVEFELEWDERASGKDEGGGELVIE